ncbi:MAG: SAM-dependent methyltransferase [Chloroflexi bacterium]|nr:MAG: SAM-dependent methyltransferase [Chloroflexota bacterium]
MSEPQREVASFRDPAGFIFQRDGIVYRQVNRVYQAHFDALVDSGLYQQLTRNGQLIPHDVVDIPAPQPDTAYCIIQPQHVPFISYPYEWTFGQLKDAALLTLALQQQAFAKGMTLKDASAYNIQFIAGKPTLIDTLSLELYEEGRPWVAYRQFCQHFLAPLALAAYRDIRLQQLLRVYIDGLPLDMVSSLLPARTRLRFGLLTHLHLHARSQKRYANRPTNTRLSERKISRNSMIGLIANLESTIRALKWNPDATPWADYYQGDSYKNAGFVDKQRLVEQFIDRVQPRIIWDMGANTGVFSRIAATKGCTVISWDSDPGAVELNYQQVKANAEYNVLPLIIDLTNPSPALGWSHQERQSLIGRSNADCILALALIHHLAIGNNVPLCDVAAFFATLSPYLIIEFVPKEDVKVQHLLMNRADIFADYTKEGFEHAFAEYYTIIEAVEIEQSQRYLYLMKCKS